MNFWLALRSPPLRLAPARSCGWFCGDRPQGREATYRIRVDELPPPSEPRQVLGRASSVHSGTQAEPNTRITPHVQWAITTQGRTGLADRRQRRHPTSDGARDCTPHGRRTRVFKVEIRPCHRTSSPGARFAGGSWSDASALRPYQGLVMRLTASADYGSIDQQVRVDDRAVIVGHAIIAILFRGNHRLVLCHAHRALPWPQRLTKCCCSPWSSTVTPPTRSASSCCGAAASFVSPARGVTRPRLPISECDYCNVTKDDLIALSDLSDFPIVLDSHQPTQTLYRQRRQRGG